MARIQTYQNDSVVTVDDKVIGTDAVDNSTKNFTVGDILALGSAATTYTAGTGINIANGVISSTVVDTDTTYTAGTGINIAGNVISSTVTDTDTKNEILVARVDQPISADPTPQPLVYSAVGQNINTDSLKIHDQSKFEIAGASVRNISGGIVNSKISMMGFTNAGGNNLDISYTLQTSTDNANWSDVKTVSRTKSAPGEYADTFGAYFRFDAGNYFRIVISSSTGGIDLLANSQVEFIAY